MKAASCFAAGSRFLTVCRAAFGGGHRMKFALSAKMGRKYRDEGELVKGEQKTAQNAEALSRFSEQRRAVLR